MSVYDYKVKTIEGKETTLAPYKGKVLLIVNVASKCGYTPQYTGLQALYEKYKDRGLEILGFPCNQFGQQEPGNEQEIQSFCSTKYDVTFPMFSKVDVNGQDAHPLYEYLKQEATGILGTKAVKWNFTKFLVDRQGKVLDRFGSIDTPEALEKKIEPLLI